MQRLRNRFSSSEYLSLGPRMFCCGTGAAELRIGALQRMAPQATASTHQPLSSELEQLSDGITTRIRNKRSKGDKRRQRGDKGDKRDKGDKGDKRGQR
eukprot:8855855-Pyramimonas_sp.AAC.1